MLIGSRFIGIVDRHGEFEGGTGTGLRLDPDPAARPLDNLLADGEADAVARVFGASVQALKDYENIVGMLGSDSDPVVAYAELPVLACFFHLYRNQRRIVAAELESVSNEILEDLRDLRAIRPESWKLSMGDHCTAFLDGAGKRLQNIFHRGIAVDALTASGVPAYA